MNILLLGFGKSNQAYFAYYQEKHSFRILEDERMDTPLALSLKEWQETLLHFDLALRSPSFPLHHEAMDMARLFCDQITNDIEEALKIIHPRAVIGVTGSNGKTTLVSMLGKGLSTQCKICVAGNIGIPIFSVLDTIDADTVLILELSSFELEEMRQPVSIGIVKNLSPNHLDQVPSLAYYYASKRKLYQLATICFAPETEMHFAKQKIYPLTSLFDAKGMYTQGTQSFSRADFSKKGSSFEEDLGYCVAVSQALQLDIVPVLLALQTYKGEPFRLQEIGEWKGNFYVNDGKSSTSSSSRYAFHCYPSPRILILGGIHKSAPFTAFDLKESDIVYIYGRDREQIRSEMKTGFVIETLQEVLQNVQTKAGYTVIFSPGCSSFDQFKNYQERANYFERCIKGEVNG